MRHVSGRFQDIRQLASLLLKLCTDTGRFLVLCLWPAPALAAENLFLRRQLALYEERQVKPSRATNATRIVMVWLTYWLDWRPALRVVKPETLTRWHRQGFRLFWRWKSKPGRPALPKDLRALIRRMAPANPTWVQERIANELLFNLGLRGLAANRAQIHATLLHRRSRQTLSLSTLVHLQRALVLAAQHGLRGADAVYAAVAQQAGCTLISLDHEHLTRLVGLISVQTPEAALAELTVAPDEDTDTTSC
jgi:predicted nucleic acid-binding protein